ncbi:hypothetical protein [Streptomyces sp. NPDC046197]|uniref:hypothetical protein n=1 Tax=Streptomyces sp. NPDC046197 TaxID=3154337 RepID=UPI0033CE7463
MGKQIEGPQTVERTGVRLPALRPNGSDAWPSTAGPVWKLQAVGERAAYALDGLAHAYGVVEQ